MREEKEAGGEGRRGRRKEGEKEVGGVGSRRKRKEEEKEES